MDLCLSPGPFASLVFGRVMVLDAFIFSILKFVCTTPDSEWLADFFTNLKFTGVNNGWSNLCSTLLTFDRVAALNMVTFFKSLSLSAQLL